VTQTIFVAKESHAAEKRVAASPETVKKLAQKGLAIIVEKGAGLASGITDAEFEAVGAKIGTAADAGKADIILRVRRPDGTEAKSARKGAAIFAAMDPYGNEADVDAMAKAGLSAFAMEFMPRITRAQSMDILSSQANLAGYRAVIDGAEQYGRAMPMMMTAAGTVPAAKVFIMGVGVAGLQAIATARRLGAIVTATDVRPATKEQVESLGAKFLAVEDDEFKQAQTAGGYAKEMSKEYQAKQAALTASHIAKQDIVITTALIPGRPAPRLVTKDMVASMRPGSVLVDLAVERGGNVEGAVLGKVVEVNGVKIVGYENVPGRLAASASLLYAKNLYAFLETMISKEGVFAIPADDELVKATLLTHGGAVVHPNFTKAAPVAAAPVAAAEPADAKPAKKAAAKPAAKPAAKADAKPAAKKPATKTASKPASKGAKA
jgi:NAD(P) transhydrogenase subunit alpha